jgi:Bacterial TSP3 repeat
MRLFLILIFSLYCAIPQLSAQGNGIEQTSELVTVGPDKFLRWYGHDERTYFIQVSDPNDHLKRWTWAPIIESGNDEDISYEVDGTADKGFFRLKYTDQPTTDPDNDDFDGDSISNIDEVSYYNSDPLDSDTDNDGMPDGYEVTYYFDLNFDEGGYDYDGDGLTNLGEYNAGTEPYYSDTDGDEMKDGFEVTYSLDPLSAADATDDEDSDGLNNLWEFKLGLNPHLSDSNNNGISDPLEDRDQDGLTNIAELSTHLTLPDQPDTDDDGLSDGWEILYGYFALVNNETDADQTNDPDDDPDSDGLLNSAEDQIGTNPNNSDTDGDGVNDFVEDQGGSNATGAGSTPNNPGGTPGGPVSPPPPTIPVQVNFGDHSGSHSEKYRVKLEPLEGDANTQKRYRTNRKYGQTQTETFHLPAGAKYKITLTHIGTDPEYDGDPKPDYDYTLEFTSNSTDTAIKAIPNDSSAMLGVHDESEEFFADGKDATLYIAWMTSETFSTVPQDRKRKKLGVSEQVSMTLKPNSLPSPTWALTGTPGTSTLSPLTGSSSFFTAGKRACTPTTEVTILGETVKIDFNVVQPTGETATKTSDMSFAAGTQGVGMELEITTLPTDVSFYNVEVLEVDKGTQNVTGFFLGFPANTLAHTPNLNWIRLDQTNQWNDSAGFDGWGFPNTWAYGTYEWAIEVRWRVFNKEIGGQGEFLANRTQTHTLHDNTGRSTESKMNNSATRTP